MNTAHEVLRFVRDFDAPLGRVWNAYADVTRRAQWSVPVGERIVYDVAHFAVDGEDRYRCGPPGDLSTLGTVRYYLIDPCQRLVFSESIRRDSQYLATALVTSEFESTDHGTRVTVLDQVTSLIGPEMVDGHRNGHHAALDQLGDWLLT